jgi:outer membrane protein TolC
MMAFFRTHKNLHRGLFVALTLLLVSPLSAEASWGSFFGKVFPFFRKNQVEEIPSSTLGLQEVIRFALRNNLLTKLALEQIRESKAQRLQVGSELLPHVSGSISENRVGRENFAAMGFKTGGLIGPYDSFDARFHLTQTVFDLSAISRFQAGNTTVKVKQYEEEFARQKVILEASLAYLEALQDKGRFKAAEANVQLAERLLKQADHQHEAQIATGVDVARATTRTAEETFQLEQARMGLTESYLQVQRVAGLPYEDRLDLSDSLSYLEEPEISVETAIDLAENNRLEIRILNDSIRAENYLIRAAKAEMLPKAELAGDYGLSGNGPRRNDRATGEIMIGATMPLFEGGKIWGAIKEASSRKRQLEQKLGDLKRQIEEDVRLALLKIKTQKQQVKTARSILGLASKELKMAQDRFGAGLGDNVEVISAQTALARARDTYISALTEYHVARLNLCFALGQTGSFNLQNADQEKE